MKLIPEQVINLRREINETRNNISEYKDYLIDKNSMSRDDIWGTHVFDSITEDNYMHSLKNLDEKERILETSEIIFYPATEYVDVGTKFEIEFNDGEIEKFTLVDTLDGAKNGSAFISTLSPIGSSLVGHKVGDTVSYKTPMGTSTVKIKSIDKDKKSYILPIRFLEYSNRIRNGAKKAIKECLENGTYQDEWLVISESQSELLKRELRGLLRNRNPEDREFVKNRIIAIKIALTRYSVNNKESSDTIGIGSSVSLKLKNDTDTYVIENVEMINHALSTEFNELYLERISSIGNVVYGLKVGDKFKVRIGTKNYDGEVTAVNGKKYVDTSSYQYVKF